MSFLRPETNQPFPWLSARRLSAVLLAATALSVSTFCTGCASKNATGGGAVSTTPGVDPTTTPLPSNIPPDQVAKIRQQQAAAVQAAKDNETKTAK